jgi:hypothetical protein
MEVFWLFHQMKGVGAMSKQQELTMQNNESKIWFPAKKYGWGWGLPCRWQGWVVMVIWLVWLLGGGIFLAPHSIGAYVAYAMVLSTVFFIIVFIKGERLRWRWGEDKTDNRDH